MLTLVRRGAVCGSSAYGPFLVFRLSSAFYESVESSCQFGLDSVLSRISASDRPNRGVRVRYFLPRSRFAIYRSIPSRTI